MASASAGASAAPLVVVAAETVYGDLALQIGGSHVAVASILSQPDADPHLFETSPSTARTISEAAIVVYNGAGYDPWMGKLLAASPSGGRTAIDVAAVSGHENSKNPHIWYDPKVLPALAARLAVVLERKDPDHGGDYRRNLETFLASLKPIEAQMAQIRAAHGGTKVTATEPVFGYMAEALGFEMLNVPFQFAMMNGTEPTPSEVAGFERSLREGAARILFYNSQVTGPSTQRLLAIAKEAGVPVVGVSETEPKDKTIQSWFAGQIDAIRSALARGDGG